MTQEIFYLVPLIGPERVANAISRHAIRPQHLAVADRFSVPCPRCLSPPQIVALVTGPIAAPHHAGKIYRYVPRAKVIGLTSTHPYIRCLFAWSGLVSHSSNCACDQLPCRDRYEKLKNMTSFLRLVDAPFWFFP